MMSLYSNPPVALPFPTRLVTSRELASSAVEAHSKTISLTTDSEVAEGHIGRTKKLTATNTFRRLFPSNENQEARDIGRILPFDWGLKVLISTGERYLRQYTPGKVLGQGSIQPLNEAILLFRDAITICPNSLHAQVALSRCLYLRFGHLHLIEDLEECMQLISSAKEATEEGQSKRYRFFSLWAAIPYHTLLQNRALVLGLRFRALGNHQDLLDCIRSQRDSLSLLGSARSQTPSSKSLYIAAGQFHLSNALLLLFKLDTLHTEQSSVLDEAISLARLAHTHFQSNLGVVFHSDHAFESVDGKQTISGLADALLERYHQSGDIQYLDEAIRLVTPLTDVNVGYGTTFAGVGEAVTKLRSHHSRRDLLLPYVPYSLQLAVMLSMRYRLTASPKDLTRGAACLNIARMSLDTSPSFYLRERGSTYANVIAALRALSTISECVPTANVDGYQDALYSFCDLCVSLIPCVAYVGLGLLQRLTLLRLTEGTASNALIVAVLMGKLQEGVEFLEKGRAQLWTQHLRLRSDFSELPGSLQRKLEEAAAELVVLPAIPQSDHIRSSGSAEQIRSSKSEEGEDHRRKLAYRFFGFVDEARRYPGFSNFLGDRTYNELSFAAKEGPVVVLIATSNVCCAIVIPGFKISPHQIVFDKAEVNMTMLTELALKLGHRIESDISRVEDFPRLKLKRQKSELGDNLSDVLSTLYKYIVKPVLASLNLTKKQGRRRPRLWWCPTGIYGFLPIHAAGDHFSVIKGYSEEGVSDYVVSSYTPTLEALIAARKHWQQFKHGQIQLSSTREEVENAAKLVPPELSLGDGIHILSSSSSMSKSIAHLAEANIVHLACHGIQDEHDPLQSSFLLGRDRLTVANLAQMNLKKGYLAILMACQTAAGDVTHPDQSVHLAAAMLFMGFRSVLATMWTMNDSHGPRLSEKIYRSLFRGGRFNTNPDDIPFVIDEFAEELRTEKCSAKAWATFMHFGM